MTKKKPDFHDADLILKLYDLRREKVMRESRNAIFGFVPKTYEEMVAVLAPDHPLNAAFRQVSSYYEMAYGFARHGTINAELLAESTVEGLILYCKVLPFLPQLRAEYSPFQFQNAEWMTKKTKAYQARMPLVLERVRKMGSPLPEKTKPEKTKLKKKS